MSRKKGYYEPTELTELRIKDAIKQFNKKIDNVKFLHKYNDILPQKLTYDKFMETVGSYRDVLKQAKALQNRVTPEYGTQKPTYFQKVAYEVVKEQENKRLREQAEKNQFTKIYENGIETNEYKAHRKIKGIEISKTSEEFDNYNQIQERINTLQERQTTQYEEREKELMYRNLVKTIENTMPDTSDKMLFLLDKLDYDTITTYVQTEKFFNFDWIYDKVQDGATIGDYAYNSLYQRMKVDGYID